MSGLLLDSVAEYLGSAVDGLAYSDETDEGNVFVDRIASSPDRAVALYSMPSQESDSKLPYDYVDFQVLARGRADRDVWAREMLMKVYSVLHGLRNVQLSGGAQVIYILAMQSSPAPMGDDENGRPEFALDFRAEVYNATVARTAPGGTGWPEPPTPPLPGRPDANFVWDQSVASSVWTVLHNLGKRCAVSVVDTTGRLIMGEIEYLDINTIRITFSAAFSGSAYFN